MHKNIFNCECNHDYDYFVNVINYKYFSNVIEHNYLDFLTNIIQFEYDYSNVVNDCTQILHDCTQIFRKGNAC